MSVSQTSSEDGGHTSGSPTRSCQTLDAALKPEPARRPAATLDAVQGGEGWTGSLGTRPTSRLAFISDRLGELHPERDLCQEI